MKAILIWTAIITVWLAALIYGLQGVELNVNPWPVAGLPLFPAFCLSGRHPSDPRWVHGSQEGVEIDLLGLSQPEEPF